MFAICPGMTMIQPTTPFFACSRSRVDVRCRLCDAIFDWGGVAQDFWKGAVKTYGWDVDKSSIEMEADTLFRKRYHVFMRKAGGKKRNRNDGGG